MTDRQTEGCVAVYIYTI